MKNLNLIFVLVMLPTLFFLASCKKEKNRICEIYNGDVGYAIGKIDEFVSIPMKVTYYYSYEVDGISYEGKEKTYGIGQDDERLIGKKFVVVYDKSNPAESDLNTDYLVESDSDFQALKKDFITIPPVPDFPNKCN